MLASLCSNSWKVVLMCLYSWDQLCCLYRPNQIPVKEAKLLIQCANIAFRAFCTVYSLIGSLSQLYVVESLILFTGEKNHLREVDLLAHSHPVPVWKWRHLATVSNVLPTESHCVHPIQWCWDSSSFFSQNFLKVLHFLTGKCIHQLTSWMDLKEKRPRIFASIQWNNVSTAQIRRCLLHEKRICYYCLYS